jgi:kynurenine formamidase
MESLESFTRLCGHICNWDRWAEDDEVGTLNYVTSEKVLEASRLPRIGKVFSLAIPFDEMGPQRGHRTRFNPHHFMTALLNENVREGGVTAADDVLVLPLQAATQWDALAHVAHNDTLYGGRPSSLVSSRGAAALSIRAVAAHVFTRAVLVDLPRYFDVRSLEPGQPIRTDDIAGALARQGVGVTPGDILLVRTGFLKVCRERDWDGYGADAPGLVADTLEWIHGSELAGVASDTTAIEVKPSTVIGQTLPFHVGAIVYMGLLLGEIFDLEELSEHCSVDGTYDFLFTAAPLPVTGGVGSPINPYVVK